MRRLALTPPAKGDLAEIGAYSRGTWGKDRAADYLGEIAGRLGRLRERPMASRSREEIFSGLRSARTGRHLVFFLFDDDQISIIRVVHEKADAPAAVLRALRETETGEKLR